MTIYDYADKSWYKLKTVKARAQAAQHLQVVGPSIAAQVLLGRAETEAEWMKLYSLLNVSVNSLDRFNYCEVLLAFLLTIDEETAQELAKEITK